MFAGLIILLPQSDIRDFSIDDADVGPPFRADGRSVSEITHLAFGWESKVSLTAPWVFILLFLYSEKHIWIIRSLLK